MMAWIRCFVRNHHNPVRHLLGGFKCGDCGEAGADLDEMGFAGGGYVRPVRRLFSRDRSEFTRTDVVGAELEGMVGRVRP